MKGKGNIDELRWVRLFTSDHIPRYLVEQIAKREYSVEDLYTYLEGNLLRMTKDGPTLNPLFHVWALVNPENLVKGFLWFTIDPLSKDMLIQVYSVDSHYWGSKQAVNKLADHMKSLRKGGGMKKIYWITRFPRHSKKYNLKPSDAILMVYNEEEKDGPNNAGITGTNKPAESRTTTVL